MKLLIFAGSTRQGSLNRQLATAAASMARNIGADVTHINLADFNIPMYNADLESGGTPADVIRLKRLLFDHPAWLICSPEYNGSYTALLKNTLDWASSPVKSDAEWFSGSKPFQGKVVGLLSASPGGMGGLRSLSHLTPLLLNLECWVCPLAYALAQANEAFDDRGQLKAEPQRIGVLRVVTQTLWAAERLQPGN